MKNSQKIEAKNEFVGTKELQIQPDHKTIIT